MTTAWSNLTHGNLVAAAQNHVSGAILGVTAIVAGIWTSIYAIGGKKIGSLPRERTVVMTAVGLTIFVFLEWMIRLVGQG